MPRKKKKRMTTTRTNGIDPMAETENKELREFAEDVRSGGSPGVGPKSKLSPAQLRAKRSEEDEVRDKAKQRFYRDQAESLVRLSEESLKPTVAAFVVGLDNAEHYFHTPREKWQSLVEPLALYMQSIEFEPESPTYHLVVLLATWGFLTWEQVETMRKASKERGPEVGRSRFWSHGSEREKTASSA